VLLVSSVQSDQTVPCFRALQYVLPVLILHRFQTADECFDSGSMNEYYYGFICIFFMFVMRTVA
jgi:hypothetical protein